MKLKTLLTTLSFALVFLFSGLVIANSKSKGYDEVVDFLNIENDVLYNTFQTKAVWESNIFGGRIIYEFDNKIQILNLENGELISTIEPSYGEFGVGILAIGNNYIATQNNSYIELWNIESGEIYRTIKAFNGNPIQAKVAINDDYIVTSEDSNYMKLWSIESGELLRIYKVGDWDIEQVAISDRYIVTNSYNGSMKLWSVVNINLLKNFGKQSIYASHYSGKLTINDNYIALGGKDGIIKLWNIESGEVIEVFKANGRVKSIDISGAHMISSHNIGDIVRIDPATGKELPFHAYMSNLNGNINLWSIESGNLLKNFKVDSGIGDVLINDNYIASVDIGNNNVIQLWDWSKYTLKNIYKAVDQKGGLLNYSWFIENYPDAPQVKNALEKIYKLVKQKNKVVDYLWFVENYSDAIQAKDSLGRAHDLAYKEAEKKNTLVTYRDFISTYPDAPQVKNALEKIYKLVYRKENIYGYSWLISNFYDTPVAIGALEQLYKLAYELTEDEGTLEAYNDFIIAYPFATQVEKAIEESYSLEEKKYSSWFTSDEKNSIALLVKYKQMERMLDEVHGKGLKSGYLLVLNRMSNLLQNEFPGESATLRYLESESFKLLYKNYKSAKKYISDKKRGVGYYNMILSQASMIDAYFKGSIQSKDIAKKYAKQQKLFTDFLQALH